MRTPIVVIADTHIGHGKGLWINHAIDIPVGANEWFNYKPTLGQRYLSSCFKHFQANLPKRYVLVINGDILQGVRVHWFREICCNDPVTMRNTAEEILTPIVRGATEAHMVQGTPFHSQDATDWEQDLAARLGKVRPVSFDAELTLDLDGKIIQFVHGRSHTQKYPTGMIESEYVDALRQAKLEGRPTPDFIVRSHMHRSAIVDELGAITPCWQLPTDYARRSGKSYVTTLGGLIISVQDGMVECRARRYPLPMNYRRPHKVR